MEKRKVQQRTIESREKIDAAALKLFCEKGYYNTNTKEIAKCAGISVGNFYNYYKDKGDVYYELMCRYVEGSCTALQQLSDTMLQSNDPKKSLHDYVLLQLGRQGDAGRFFDDCHVLIKDSERLQEIFTTDTVNVIETIEHMLRSMKGVRPSNDYAVKARMLFTVIDQTSRDIVNTKGTEMFDEYVEQFVEMLCLYIFE